MNTTMASTWTSAVGFDELLSACPLAKAAALLQHGIWPWVLATTPGLCNGLLSVRRGVLRRLAVPHRYVHISMSVSADRSTRRVRWSAHLDELEHFNASTIRNSMLNPRGSGQ